MARAHDCFNAMPVRIDDGGVLLTKPPRPSQLSVMPMFEQTFPGPIDASLPQQ
jgi:hypothetical protein